MPPSVAAAQSGGAPADGRARLALLQSASAYQNLDVDGAVNELREALRRCGRNHCATRLVADLHATLGLVLLGGRNDSDGVTGICTKPPFSPATINARLPCR